GGASMTVPVVVVPSGLVLVAGIVGHEFLEERGKIVLGESWLILDGGECGGAADHEQVHDPLSPDVAEPLGQLRAEVDDGGIAFRFAFERESLHGAPAA